jgi:branched-chain amino acid transport system substrate-binding protein
MNRRILSQLWTLIRFSVLSLALGTNAFSADKEFGIGVLAPTTGAFAGLGEDMVAGIKLFLSEHNNSIGGRPVKLYVADTQLDADMAVQQAQKLVNQNKVSVVLGPLSGGESLAIKQAAKEWPNTTFLTIGAANLITMKDPAPNVYRPSFAGGQPVYPLAEWAIQNQITKIVTIGEDYAFPWDQIGGFAYAYCKLGGHISKAFWTPIGTADYSSIIAQLKALNPDAVFIAYGGADAVTFTKQLNDFGLIGKLKVLAGSSFGDATTLAEVGSLLDGTMSGSIYSGQLPFPEFKSFDASFKKANGRSSSLFAEGGYEMAEFVDAATTAVNGNVEGNADAFHSALDKSQINSPRGPVHFDETHNAVANDYLNQVKNIDGVWTNVLVKTIPDVGQFFTFDPTEFRAALPFGRDNPTCP